MLIFVRTKEYQAMIAVQFPRCGAEKHPAFSSAIVQSDGTYILHYPRAKWISTAKKTQQAWATDKLNHLRSWGVTGAIIN